MEINVDCLMLLSRRKKAKAAEGKENYSSNRQFRKLQTNEQGLMQSNKTKSFSVRQGIRGREGAKNSYANMKLENVRMWFYWFTKQTYQFHLIFVRIAIFYCFTEHTHEPRKSTKFQHLPVGARVSVFRMLEAKKMRFDCRSSWKWSMINQFLHAIHFSHILALRLTTAASWSILCCIFDSNSLKIIRIFFAVFEFGSSSTVPVFSCLSYSNMGDAFALCVPAYSVAMTAEQTKRKW